MDIHNGNEPKGCIETNLLFFLLFLKTFSIIILIIPTSKLNDLKQTQVGNM